MNLQDLISLINPLHVTNRKAELEVDRIVQDSRQITHGSAFIAIRGTEVDGHIFLDDAVARGAKVLICEESYYTEEEGVCVIEVENTRAILGKVAQAFAGNPGQKLRTIGITGTNGKTTTATLVYQILMKLGRKASLLGTVSKKILDKEFGSSLTTSDPIELANDMKAMVEAGSEFVVMEVSSHALHQNRVTGIDFEVAAFTNLSHDHLDYHQTLDEYAKAKKLLFDGLSEQATAIINVDDAYGSTMYLDTKAAVNTFSYRNDQNHILTNSAEGLTLIVDGVNIQSPLIGQFNAYNVAQAFLICKALGIPALEAAKTLSECTGASGRMETVLVDGENLPIVIVDYAHTPDALENVLATLKSLKQSDQNLICVFGAGGDRDPKKRPEMAKAAEKFSDLIYVTSDNPRFEDPKLIVEDILKGFSDSTKATVEIDRKEAIHSAISEAQSRDIVLLAGKGHEDYQDVRGVKHHMDDREIAREALIAIMKGGN